MISHELRVIAVAIAQSHNKEFCFMSLPFWVSYAKALPGCSLRSPVSRKDAKTKGRKREKEEISHRAKEKKRCVK